MEYGSRQVSDAAQALPEVPFAERLSGLRGSPIDDLDTLLAGRTGLLPLASGTPRLDDLPAAELAALASELIAESPVILNYGLTRGDPELRSQLMTFAGATGDGEVGEDELIVTTSAMQALDLVAKLFLDAGDVVLVESPTYSDALATFSAYRPQLVEVPSDEEGIAVDRIPDLVDRLGRAPKLIYVIPTFQNPAGTELSPARAQALLDLADRYGSIVLDDDPYRLLRYEGSIRASLRALGGERPNVIGVRSSSKLIAPGLRVGWAVGHRSVIDKMVTAKQGMDTCTSNLNQRIVARFLERGLLDERLRTLRREYATRRDSLDAALAASFDDGEARWNTPAGGYFVWLTLTGGHSAEDLLHEAVEQGVSFVPGPAFSASGRFESSLRICFVATTAAGLEEAVRRMRAAYDGLATRR